MKSESSKLIAFLGVKMTFLTNPSLISTVTVTDLASAALSKRNSADESLTR
jgi:hypothetical protein